MPFSEEYFRLFENTPVFHDRVAQKYVLATSGPQVSERLLQCIWYDRLYDEQRLTTCDGRKITVHSPGTWNLESGPDFKNADLTIGERRVKGDVELHIDSSGWRSHGHSSDPNYDRVVLHVTLTSRGKSLPALSRHGVEIPEVSLWDCLTDNLKLLKCALRPEEYPYKSMRNYGRCHGLLERMPPEAGQRLLLMGGDARMIAKQRRFGYESERQDLDQVAYAAMLEGMGYKAYTKQFGQLAQRLPYERLRERALSSDSKVDTVRLTQALLLGAAGLLRDSGSGRTAQAREYLAQIQRLWNEHGFDDLDGNGIVWKASAVRPANLPERRIAGISHVLARSYGRGIFESMLDCISDGDARKTRTKCIEYMTHADEDFWLHHYTIAGKTLPRPVAIVGRDRAMTIVVNSFVPLGLLHARSEGDTEKEEFVHRLYCKLPGQMDNNITRLMEYRLFGGSPKRRFSRSARTQQGFLQIFADWCSEDPSCENCGVFAGLQNGYIGEKLEKMRI